MIKDCWIVGDRFVNDIYYGLAEANQSHKRDQGEQLFIYSNFNIRGFVSNLLTKIKEAPARLVNSLIHAFNEKPAQDAEGRIVGPAQFLPCFIIVIADWDIVKHISHYKYGISRIAHRLIKWIITNMDRAIQTRKDDLSRIKMGAVVATEPKVVWVKMIDRAGCQDKALAVRGKFNSILEDILVDHSNHYIMEINAQLCDASFFANNTLNTNGAIRYWLEIDKLICMYEKHDISLMPIKALDQPSFRMPPPPPEGGRRRLDQQDNRHQRPNTGFIENSKDANHSQGFHKDR